MITNVKIPDKHMKELMKVSRSRTPAAAVRWAVSDALRKARLRKLASSRKVIEFRFTGDDLEAREINDQKRQRSR